MFSPEPLRGLTNDGLYMPTIKIHSLDKFRAHNYNVQMFATAMKSRWPQRAYIGLYSGAGLARLQETGEIVETTALSVFRIPDPFTHYVFVDKDPRCTQALRVRTDRVSSGAEVTILTGDVNTLVPEVLKALPRFGPKKGLISYCFVDPFAADLRFDTIRQLGWLRMDFLILLMLGLDARVNFRAYLADEGSTRIADLVDCPQWREEWLAESRRKRARVIQFLTTKFDQAMRRIGYRPASPEDALSVKVPRKNVLIYQLVFYSKDSLGQEFWKRTRQGVADQPDLFEEHE